MSVLVFWSKSILAFENGKYSIAVTEITRFVGAKPKDEKVADRVFFEFDSSAITPEGQEVLSKQAVFINQNPSLDFIVEGHCDERGTREYNLALAERRANSAKQYLVSLGINPSKLKTVSYGKERPAVSGTGEWAWSQNRRAVTLPK